MTGIVRPGEGSPTPGAVVTAAVVSSLPPGSAVVINSVDGQYIDEPYTARIVGVGDYLVCPAAIADPDVRPRDGETYRVLWVQGQEDI